MFDSLFTTYRTSGDAAQNAWQPQKTQEQIAAEGVNKQLADIQKVVDAMCKVYVAKHAKEIADRGFSEKFYQTDQPIIDRAALLDLQHKIKVAQMELSELKRGAM